MPKSTKKCGHTRHRKNCLVCHLSRAGRSRSLSKIAAVSENLSKARAAKAMKAEELLSSSL
jgi:hypothetical protein